MLHICIDKYHKHLKSLQQYYFFLHLLQFELKLDEYSWSFILIFSSPICDITVTNSSAIWRSCCLRHIQEKRKHNRPKGFLSWLYVISGIRELENTESTESGVSILRLRFSAREQWFVISNLKIQIWPNEFWYMNMYMHQFPCFSNAAFPQILSATFILFIFFNHFCQGSLFDVPLTAGTLVTRS